jgi:hypothetical protein
MKKLLTIAAIFAIVLLGITGALAVIPHAHGDDFDHSKHQTCPVYQAGLHAPALALFGVVFSLFLAAASRYVSGEPLFFFFTRLTHTSLRAPPVLA